MKYDPAKEKHSTRVGTNNRKTTNRWVTTEKTHTSPPFSSPDPVYSPCSSQFGHECTSGSNPPKTVSAKPPSSCLEPGKQSVQHYWPEASMDPSPGTGPRCIVVSSTNNSSFLRGREGARARVQIITRAVAGPRRRGGMAVKFQRTFFVEYETVNATRVAAKQRLSLIRHKRSRLPGTAIIRPMYWQFTKNAYWNKCIFVY